MLSGFEAFLNVHEAKNMVDCRLKNVETLNTNIRLMFGILNASLSVASLFGNLIIIVVILYHPGLRTRPNHLICCLAITDLFVGLVVQPMVAARLVLRPLWDKCLMADLVTYVGSVLCGTSACLLCVISYDRYLHIVKWQTYDILMTRKRLSVLIAICWSIPLIGSLFCLFHYLRTIYYILLTILSSSIAVIVSFYYKQIFVFVREKRKVLHAKRLPESSETSDQAQFKRHLQLAVNFAIIISCFVICWLPLTIFSIYVVVIDLTSKASVTPDRNLVTIRYIVVTFGMLNSSINPVIYFWRNKALREGTLKFIVKKILRR